MAHYFIGDLQGCFDGLQRALASVEFNAAKDTLWLTGDLIARGSQSLETLAYLYQNQDSIRTVLGNHDLHLLSVVNKVKKPNPKDLLTPLLNSDNVKIYADWLRQQPLLLELPDGSGYMSHAGLPPDWQADDAVYWSSQVSHLLTRENYAAFLPEMYGKKPTKWHPQLSELEKLKYTVNALTRMRFCTLNGELDFDAKCAPTSSTNSDLQPWFNHNPERFMQKKWIFGHWAALMGKTNNHNVIALDTGYVWGGHLSIYQLNNAKRFIIQNLNK